MSTNPKCEKCGTTLVPIVYGLPSPEDFEKAEEGEFVLGGCVVSFDDPEWSCLVCQKLTEGQN